MACRSLELLKHLLWVWASILITKEMYVSSHIPP